MKSKIGGPPLSFPETLAGTWPAIGEPMSRDDLRHVGALDSMCAAITSLRKDVQQSIQNDRRLSLTSTLTGLSRRMKGLLNASQTSHAGVG